LLDGRRLKVLLRQDDEAALLVLVALDEIRPRHRVAVADAHALEPHRRLVLRVQHPEMRPMVAHRRVQLVRNVHEAEGNRSFPQHPRTSRPGRRWHPSWRFRAPSAGGWRFLPAGVRGRLESPIRRSLRYAEFSWPYRSLPSRITTRNYTSRRETIHRLRVPRE